MWRTFRQTAALPTTRLVLVIDRDDPTFNDYPPAEGFRARYGWDPDAPFVMGLAPEETGTLVRATNSAASKFWDQDIIIGHVGDDHRFRTLGWDRRIAEILTEPGIAYGDDLLQGEMLPTAPFISSVIPRSLGWYALPSCKHMFIDNAWKRLGQALGSYHYLPDVVIEHMHPGAGKGQLDEGYLRADASTDIDRVSYHHWRYGGGLDADVAVIRGAMAA